MNTSIEIDRITLGAAVMTRLDHLATHSTEPDALTRLYLDPAYAGAMHTVGDWMRDAGMIVRIDAVGTVIGRYEAASADQPALLLGSHIDTVRNAGKYDGALGVVAAIEAVRWLNDNHIRLAVAIEVIALGNEEGVRFPVALTGSRALAGTLDAGHFDASDDNGVTIRDALHDTFRLGDLPSIGTPSDLAYPPGRALGFVELHIEQGPVLEAENLPVGIVTAIAGAERHVVELTGVAGHAGTVPMALRHDALTAAAEMILEIETLARNTPAIVATVGTIAARPGAVNVIPAEASFSIDLRSADDAARTAAFATLQSRFAEIADRRGIGLNIRHSYEEKATTCAPALIEALQSAITRAGIAPRHLASGAGHDGLALAALCPIAMLFVRCKGGISHNPAESITAADAGIATAVLIDFLTNTEGLKQ